MIDYVRKRGFMNNSKIKDCNAKVVLENPKLCLQLLQDYLGLDIFKNVKVENIEDVTERFLPMFTEERDADVIKKIKIDDTDISQNREDAQKDTQKAMRKERMFFWKLY